MKRNYGIDLFRIVAMFMIVIIHVLAEGEELWYVQYFSVNYYVVWFMYMFVYCGLDCFGLISGYVGYNSKFKPSKLAKMWLQMVFYGILFMAVFCLISKDNFDVSLLKKAIMPITQSEYWYLKVYFIVFLVMPFINAGINYVDKRTLEIALIALFILFTVPSLLTYTDIFGINEGYSVVWIGYLYMVGAYLGKYDVAVKFGKKKALRLLIATFAINFVAKVGLEFVSNKIYVEARFGYHFVNHASPFMALEAIALLMVFANLKVKESKAIKSISAATLGVYMVHMNPYIHNQVLKDCTKSLVNENAFILVGVTLLFSIGFFVLGTVLEEIRIKIFETLRITKLCEKIDKGLGL